MSAAELLDRIWHSGLHVVSFDADHVTVAPASRLTPDLRSAIAVQKDDLIDELRIRLGEMIIDAFLRDLEGQGVDR
jgi:hypothetical protein